MGGCGVAALLHEPRHWPFWIQQGIVAECFVLATLMVACDKRHAIVNTGTLTVVGLWTDLLTVVLSRESDDIRIVFMWAKAGPSCRSARRGLAPPPPLHGGPLVPPQTPLQCHANVFHIPCKKSPGNPSFA